MHTDVYNTSAWRQLPRTRCLVEQLLGVEGCAGRIHRHHVDPSDPWSRTISVCAAHHSQLHAVLRTLEQRRRCHHRHTTRAAREECERRLNRAA